MFVLNVTHKRIVAELGQELMKLQRQKADLVSEVNGLRNHNDFLRGQVQYQNDAIRRLSDMRAKENQFSDSDLRKMLMLCHPDKHDGKPMAQEITSKINEARRK